MPFIARHLKHLKGHKIANMTAIFKKSIKRWESVQFLAPRIDMKLYKIKKKFSYAIAALDNLLAVTLKRPPQESKVCDHGI